MIWFFLMGMIGGAVGMMMLAGWWVKSHSRRVSAEEMIRELREAGYQEIDISDHPEGQKVSEPERDPDGTGDLESGTERSMEDKES